MFTGKRPTNDLFGGNVTLNSYIKLALPERVLDIADNSILNSGLRAGFPLDEYLIMVFKVGLRCCEESPKNRLATSEARKDCTCHREKGRSVRCWESLPSLSTKSFASSPISLDGFPPPSSRPRTPSNPPAVCPICPISPIFPISLSIPICRPQSLALNLSNEALQPIFWSYQ
ncbi:hypothetical protein YC2023_061622 [Brassica napus]